MGTIRDDLNTEEPRFRMTLEEAKAAGQAAYDIEKLVPLVELLLGSGELVVKAKTGVHKVALTQVECEAILGLLIERRKVLLASMNVDTEPSWF